jgi:short-subunit dehydrogenase
MPNTPKTILIKGCSSGIGLCAATVLLKKGYRVFASARKMDDVNELSKKGFESIQLDVNDSQSIRQGINEVLEKTQGTLDAVFNNSGFVLAGAVEDLSRDMMREQFETNVFGAMELTNLVIPVMRKQGHGRIIQNGSLLAIVTMPYRGAYCASKFALEGFSNTLRQELRGTNIFVSIIEPGPIESRLRKNAVLNYSDHLKNKVSVHNEHYKKMESYYFNPPEGEQKFALSPEAVVNKLIHALESKHPKAHYYVGLPAHAFSILRRLLPDCALDWVMNKVSQSEAK